MGVLAQAEEHLRRGELAAALSALQNAVRANPADAKLRTFLFQLLCVLGQWDRATTQLNVVSEMDAKALAMKQMYGDALQCEALRAKVFAGEKAPMVFGYPDEWLALLIEALLTEGRGQAAEAAALRSRAFEGAPATSGKIDDKPFEWIADADSRLGPVLEAVINNRYYWVPFHLLTQVDIEAPEDLRDCVWMPAHLQFSNGGESVALIPTRYAGSAESSDDLIRLARKTEWSEFGENVYKGLGQRIFATEGEEYALMDIRRIELTPAPSQAEAGEPEASS